MQAEAVSSPEDAAAEVKDSLNVDVRRDVRDGRQKVTGRGIREKLQTYIHKEKQTKGENIKNIYIYRDLLRNHLPVPKHG